MKDILYILMSFRSWQAYANDPEPKSIFFVLVVDISIITNEYNEP